MFLLSYHRYKRGTTSTYPCSSQKSKFYFGFFSLFLTSHTQPEHVLILQYFHPALLLPPSPGSHATSALDYCFYSSIPTTKSPCAGSGRSLGFIPASVFLTVLGWPNSSSFGFFHTMIQNEHEHIHAQDVLNTKKKIQKLWWVRFLSDSQWTNQPWEFPNQNHTLSL